VRSSRITGNRRGHGVERHPVADSNHNSQPKRYPIERRHTNTPWITKCCDTATAAQSPHSERRPAIPIPSQRAQARYSNPVIAAAGPQSTPPSDGDATFPMALLAGLTGPMSIFRQVTRRTAGSPSPDLANQPAASHCQSPCGSPLRKKSPLGS
jgi:hypothetical protein